MPEMDKEHSAKKVTITFADGHTEEYDTFIVAVAMGLTPVGKDEEGNTIYIAEQGKFNTQGILHIVGTPDISIGLINTLMAQVESLVPSEPEVAMSFLMALLTIHSRPIESFSREVTRKLNFEDN